jgi:hypothetical protein
MERVNLETSYLRVQQCISQSLIPRPRSKKGRALFELGDCPSQIFASNLLGASALLRRWLEERGVENGPKVDDPAQQYKPEDCGQAKLDNCH